MSGVTTVIVMTSMSVASGLASGILKSLDKETESTYVTFGTVCLIICTALTAFIKVVKALNSLGG